MAVSYTHLDVYKRQFGEIIRGKKPGRESDDEIILVSIEGMPTEDVAWAYECYTYALVHLSLIHI